MKNRFPIYIPSKSRHDSRYTVKALQRMGCDFYVIVEAQQFNDYASVIDKKHLLILDPAYQENYNTCDNLGLSKSVGPGAARNFAWDHSIKNGFTHHWVMDDNIRSFMILNNNSRIRCYTPAFFRSMEDFILRYKNVGMAGPNYKMFVPSRAKHPPYALNTRIYSCNLIRNDLPFRWRGRYNEDTDLSLMILKSGLCTVQFYMFLQDKIATQMVKGGNTEVFYGNEGTLNKSKMLARLHPDCCEVVYKFGRWHHKTDYSSYKQPLIRVDNYEAVKRSQCKFDLVSVSHLKSKV